MEWKKLLEVDFLSKQKNVFLRKLGSVLYLMTPERKTININYCNNVLPLSSMFFQKGNVGNENIPFRNSRKAERGFGYYVNERFIRFTCHMHKKQGMGASLLCRPW